MTVIIKGSGFFGVQPIIINFNGATIVTDPLVVTSTPTGSFCASFAMQGGLVGQHLISASDGVNSATAILNSMLTATINPVTSQSEPGYVGQEITVEGKGFNPSGTIVVKYDQAQVGNATASATGAFSVKFKMRPSSGGEHIITLTDGTNSRTFIYYLDKSPPSAPVLIKPPEGSEQKPETFEWSEVVDPSGVTYVLQIARDMDFADILIEKRGLETAVYILDAADKIPSSTTGDPYYWRVLAIDKAGNPGAPSETWSISVRPFLLGLPTALLFAIGAMAPLLIGGSAIAFMRRLSAKKKILEKNVESDSKGSDDDTQDNEENTKVNGSSR
jgi:hypothetical protein